MKRKIIIIGGTHHNTLSMIRCMGEVGRTIDLLLLGEPSFVSKSKYINKLVILKDEEQISDVLLTQYGQELEKPIVISCSDTAQCELDWNYDILKEHFCLFNCNKQGALINYMNKQLQDDIVEKSGIRVPKSFIYKGSLDNAIYPCMLKPVESINGGKKVVICNSETEAKQALKQFNNILIQVQQFIKKDYEIVLVGVSNEAEVYIPGFIRKHRDFDGGTLYSTVYPIENLPVEIVYKCQNMVSQMDYTGLFGIELIASHGEYYFIEINLRNDATTYALAKAGANLPELYVKYFETGELQPKSSKVNMINSIVEFNDMKHRKRYGISILQWLYQYFNSECKYYWSWKDPKPFFYAPFK